MSNVIKAYSIRYEENTKLTLENYLHMERELEERRKRILQEAMIQRQMQAQEGFVEGLKAMAVEVPAGEQETGEKTAKALEYANQEAAAILENARAEAERIKKEAHAQGQARGYEEGVQKGRAEVQQLKAEYEKKAGALEKQYEEMVTSLEPEIAGIIASLVEKITGIMMEGHDEVVLYLVSQALRHMEKAEEYTLRVSKENYEAVSLQMDLLLEAIGREAALRIQVDPMLGKNQCLVETQGKVINCSLDVQLNNLITDLRLMADS